jgi:hypothetical protein
MGKALPFRRLVLAVLALLWSLGCASSPPPKQPTVAPAAPLTRKFVAPTPESNALLEEWIGSYTGTVDVYTGEEGRWQEGTSIQLLVQPDGQGRLRILGHVMLTAGQHSFYLADIALPSSSALAGEQVEAGESSSIRYEYSLSRSGTRITGTVRSFKNSSAEGPAVPQGEWRFEVSRQLAPAFR